MMFSRTWFKTPHQSVAAGQSESQPLPLGVRRQPQDALERFVVQAIDRRGALTHAGLLSLVTGWIAREERSTGGALDLVVWSDDLWRDEAQRAVTRLERDLLENATPEPMALR